MFCVEKFIEDIKSHRELYDKRNLEYSNVFRKHKIWQELSEKYGIEAKSKWTYLRDKYVREKRKISQPSGSAALSKKPWELLPLMDFLHDTIQPRRMRENFEDKEPSIFEGIDCSFSTEIIEFDNQENETGELTSSTLESNVEQSLESDDGNKKKGKKASQTKKRNIDNLFVDAIDSFKRKMAGNSQGTAYTADEEDEFFLKSIGCKMKKMLPAAKSQFKIKILMEADNFAELNY